MMIESCHAYAPARPGHWAPGHGCDVSGRGPGVGSYCGVSRVVGLEGASKD